MYTIDEYLIESISLWKKSVFPSKVWHLHFQTTYLIPMKNGVMSKVRTLRYLIEVSPRLFIQGKKCSLHSLIRSSMIIEICLWTGQKNNSSSKNYWERQISQNLTVYSTLKGWKLYFDVSKTQHFKNVHIWVKSASTLISSSNFI